MGLSLKQPKDVLVLFFGIAGLILVVFPLFMMIVLKKGVLKILAGSSREDQEYEAQSFFSCSLSTGRNKIAKEETDKHGNKQDIMPG